MTLAVPSLWRRAALCSSVLMLLVLAACGGGDGGGSGSQPSMYSVSATVNGLTSTGLVLQLNGASSLGITNNGAAKFATSLASGTAYAVSVATQPAGQSCSVANGTGTIGAANVSSPTVSCNSTSTPQYTVAVNVTGFATGPTLVLQLNGLSQLAITANGTATFTPLLGTGENYVVSVKTQPTPPPQQNCSVTNGSGTIGTANITNVNVNCTTTYSVSVTAYGMVGSGLTVQLNGADDLTLTDPGQSDSGSGTFSTGLAAGATYVVTIKTQPTAPTQTCTLSNGSGTMGTANVSVELDCPLLYAATSKGDWTRMSFAPSLEAPAPECATPSPFNSPGERVASMSWADASGNLWLFGGTGAFSDEEIAYDDLWRYSPSTGVWVCVTLYASPSFGTKGVPSPTNYPPADAGANSWTDASGNFWLFGGDYNALWRYNPTTNVWTWISGSSTAGATGVYGAQGTPTATTQPGSRYGSVSWIDRNGNLWIFGGGPTGPDVQNDLWEYSFTTGQWVWVGGSVAGTDGTGPAGVYGTKGVPATTNVPGGRTGAVGWTDATGNLWLFGGSGIDSKGNNGALNDLWKYTPAAGFGALGTWTWVGGADTTGALGVYGSQGIAAPTNFPGARAMSTSWTDRSGNFWMFGGSGCASGCQLNQGFPVGPEPLNDLWELNPSTGSWTWVKGSNGQNGGEVFGTPGVPSAANTPGAWMQSIGWTDSSGNLWLYGGAQIGIFFYSQELWVYTPQ
jgi:hypothetical protein